MNRRCITGECQGVRAIKRVRIKPFACPRANRLIPSEIVKKQHDVEKRRAAYGHCYKFISIDSWIRFPLQAVRIPQNAY